MATSEWTWGATKTHGLTVGDRFEYGGIYEAAGPLPPMVVTVTASHVGGTFVTRDGVSPFRIGGVATCYWARAVRL